ncbi:TonB-dependent receptor [Aliifodinibius sp. S!AR15-10]|uniref:TonB-dependent receptor n=1 Tax=Aliifodinibius sp. S!AR15-10 TaxID=2950437 RepID=UPI00285B54E8|nr:TonB-dependent receptor [Aliifodinibius sp. S!AR15-10]MDR8392733.1 TonB-dependent receptor [Aliifodinibius sp. S!AR15-10]
MRTFTIVAILLFIPFSHLLAQQTASVSGYVSDSQNGETLIAANVALEGTKKGTSTNTSGYYTITNVQPGAYNLVVSYIGYQSYSQKVSLEPGENLRLDIELTPQGVQMDEIVVESEVDKEEQRNIGVAQVQTELIKEVPSVFEADVFRSVQLLPGVKAASDFSSGLYIRGGSPDQTLILLDRTTVYNPTHFFGFFSTFNPDAVKDVRLYKGGYPAEYGGRLGSVLTIYNKDGNRNEFSGSASVGLLASRFSIEGPFKKGSYMLAVRRSTLEPLLAALRQSQDNIPESFYFLDLNGKVNVDADPNNKFSLAFYSGIDNLLFPFSEDASIKLNYGNQTVSSTWTHIFSNKVFSHFTVTGSRYFNFPSFNIATTPFERSNNIYDFSVKGDIEYHPNDRHSVSTGIWSGIMTLKVQDTFDGEDTFSSRIQSNYLSVYAQDEWAITNQLDLTAGLRLNGFSEGNYWKLAPRLSLEYRPIEEIRLQAAYGRYNQFLTLISNEAFSGFDTWLTTDNGVQPAYGDQYVLGAKTQPWEGYGIDMELYYRTMEDLFDLNPFIPDVAGLDYAELFRFGTGYAYGVELKFERQIGRLTGFMGYTFSVSRRKYPGFNTPVGKPQNARFFPPKYDRKHDVNLVMNYRLSERWKASAVFNYSTGQAYTKPLGRTLAFDYPTESQPLDVLVIGKVNASRLPAYHRLDVGFTRSGSFFGLGDAQWQFQLINVYSRRNIWFYNYDFDENPIEREDVTMLPILPNISYTVNF